MKRYSIDLSDVEESEMEDDKNGEWCMYEIAQDEIDELVDMLDKCEAPYPYCDKYKKLMRKHKGE